MNKPTEGIVMPNDRATLDIRFDVEMHRLSLALAHHLEARREGVEQVIKDAVANFDIEGAIKASIQKQLRDFALRNIDIAVTQAFHEAWGGMQKDVHDRVKAEIEAFEWKKKVGAE